MGFVEDFIKLQFATPRLAIINTNSENSSYTNYATFNRNCYLVSGTHYSEDVYYAQYCVKLTSCMDCFDVEKSELCYELVFSEKCYNCSCGCYLVSCSDCDFCYDLTNCHNCFLSVCLQNAEYAIFNQKYTKEEYENKKRFLLKTNTRQELWQKLHEFRLTIPQRDVFQKNCEQCVGSDLRNSKNLWNCFSVKNGEDVIYGGTNCNQIKDSIDCDNIAATLSQNLYQCIGVTGSYNIMYGNIIWFSHDVSYCELMFNSSDCFGCIGRNHAQYEILNVKYPKEEYFRRVDEIKKELKTQRLWGTILIPATYSYEDTIAAIQYPD